MSNQTEEARKKIKINTGRESAKKLGDRRLAGRTEMYSRQKPFSQERCSFAGRQRDRKGEGGKPKDEQSLLIITGDAISGPEQ